MLKDSFIGRRPSQFQANTIVKYFIISETFLWSAWNFVMPIFAIFAANKVEGGNIEIAASAYSVYLVIRVMFELLSGNYLNRKGEVKKIYAAIIGMFFISFSYLGFAFTNTVTPLFIYYGIAGIGLGISSPAKNSLFSTHLDKDRESAEWGFYDAAVFMGMALSAALGGFIANKYGFRTLFLLASIVNLIGIIPYLSYLSQYKQDKALRQTLTHVPNETPEISHDDLDAPIDKTLE